jgi:hypothetical protein
MTALLQSAIDALKLPHVLLAALLLATIAAIATLTGTHTTVPSILNQLAYVLAGGFGVAVPLNTGAVTPAARTPVATV